MKSTIAFRFVPLVAAVLIVPALIAQGPPPEGGRGFGPRGFGGGRGGGLLGAGPSRTPVTGAPYSAVETLVRQQPLANGNQISTKEQTNVYRDGQGRMRTETTVTPRNSSGTGTPVTIVTIFDPVAGYQYRLDSSTMVARQTALPPARPADSTPRTPPSRPNMTTTDLGTQVINGVAAKGTQLTETIPAGAIGNAQAIQIVRVTWVSTELKVPVQIKTNDPRNGTSDMELTNIAQAEPSASLFVVPAGYTVKQGGGPDGRGGGGPRGNGRRGPGPR
jgi:outer membrane lipoprotein-sorting protein